MKPSPHFTAHIVLNFEARDHFKQYVFAFGENLLRLATMQMEGVEGLNTVALRIEKPAKFTLGQEFDAECRVISPDLFFSVVTPGVKLKLWDGGFFANGVVTQRIEAGWQTSSKI